jgi:hypothetical protein
MLSSQQQKFAARDVLPRSLPPRALCRVQSAAYVGVSPTKFDEMVRDGRMPPPIRIDGRCVWDVRRLDRAFDDLAVNDDAPTGNEMAADVEANAWDAILK